MTTENIPKKKVQQLQTSTSRKHLTESSMLPSGRFLEEGLVQITQALCIPFSITAQISKHPERRLLQDGCGGWDVRQGYLFSPVLLQLLLDGTGRPDITVMVDWALKINYLFVVVGSLTCTCLWHTGTQVFISFGLIRRDILPVP